MTRHTETSLTLNDILRMLFKHKKKVLFCMFATMAAAVAGIVYWPRSYVSDAALFVRMGRESVGLDPTATTGDTIQVATSREVEINTVLGVLRSRVLAEQVVDALGPDTILARSAEPSDRPSRFTGWIPSLDPISGRERAVHYLRRRLEATAERNSDIITVWCTAKTPGLAQRIVAAMLDVYFNEHVRLHRAPDSHTFFADQAALVQEQLTKAVEELRDAKNEAELISIEGQRKVLHDEMSAIETELLRTQPVLAASEEKIATLRQALEHVPERITTDEITGYPNMAADLMRSQLYDLQKHEAKLASNFVGDYPLLAATRQQVKTLEATLAEQEPRRTQLTTAVNSVHQQLEKDLLAEEATAGSLKAEIQALGEQHALLKERFKALNDQEAHIAELEQKVGLLQGNYQEYSKKLEQSRIDDALASQRITNVNIVQPASYVAKPVSPKKPMMLALGIVAAMLLGFCVAAMAEGFERRERTPEEMEVRLPLNVPASVPKTPRRHVVAEFERMEQRCEVATASGPATYAGADSADAE